MTAFYYIIQFNARNFASSLTSGIDFQQNKPWIIKALRRVNIYEGICKHYIDVELQYIVSDLD